MTDLQTLKAIETLRGQIAGIDAKQVKAGLDLQKAKADLELQQRKARIRDSSPVSRKLAAKIKSLGTMQETFLRDRSQLQDRLKDHLSKPSFSSPQELVGNLDADVPIALFPIKIETRFMRAGSKHELRVRMFPDQVAISALQEALNEVEIEHGKMFWQEVAQAHQDADLNKRKVVETAAANSLAKRTQGNRTLWVALQLRPKNWPVDAEKPTPTPSDLEFPKSFPKPSNSAAAIRILADKFVVELHRDNKLVHSKTGAPIQDTLMMAPDGDGQTATLDRDKETGEIKASETLHWLFDYDAAVEVGMAVTIPITSADHTKGFDKVLAMGVRYSQTPQASAKDITQHFQALRFSTGIDILPQGTPTNNTETAKSGYTSGEAGGAEDVLKYLNNTAEGPVSDHRIKSDGQRLAEALGLDPNITSTWLHGDNQDVSEALAMNRAVWSATIGGYMRDFLNPLLGGETQTVQDRRLAGQITSFGTDYVTGRGLLPALRVGRQPYGVLVTSDFNTYDAKDSFFSSKQAFPITIKPVMDKFTTLFRGFEDRLKAIGQDGVPEDILTNILGLHASSVTFKSRKGVADAVSWNNMLMLGFDEVLAEAFFNFVLGMRQQTLNFIGLGGGVREISEITFMGETDDLDGPVVDGDPTIPLSEVALIRPFNDTQNYVDWLLTSSADIIRKQEFRDANGDGTSRPTALLYKYLRHALLAEIGEQSAAFASKFAEKHILREQSHISLVGADSDRSALKLADDAATVLKTEVVGVDSSQGNLGNYLWSEARRVKPVISNDQRPFTLSLIETKEALGRLAGLPTARLERLFAEHMDTCSYRLDAWHTGMFTSRLRAMRSKNKKSKGSYYGLYGYVENLKSRPAPRKLRESDIPKDLRPDGVKEVTVFPDNGGFVHAPSQAHAVTAAVLRNGYLSHANRTQENRFAINLDSSRVRKAMAIVEGLRGNQTLSVLLGYRLERGLHENHPGLELDTFIYVLRERFPITSKRLNEVETGHNAEVIEARNVVDGYDLIQHAEEKLYPWGIKGLPKKSTHPDEANAIIAEVDELEDMLDAYGDLMMSESVHQAVNGSVERARGVLQSIENGDVPPLPEVIQSPNSGTVLTQNIIAHFPAASHWPTRTARSKVNARMNGWLKSRLPNPSKITIGFRLEAGGQSHLTLAAAGLDALDVVLMANDQQGNGASLLERWLVDHWRSSQNIPESTITQHAKGPAAPNDASVLEVDTSKAPANKHALDDVLPLLLSLQRLVTKSRPANGLDYRVSTELENALPHNPKGLSLSGDEPAARPRIASAFDTFESHLEDLGTFVQAPGQVAAYNALLEDIESFELGEWQDFSTNVRDTMRNLALFGFSQAIPGSATGTTSTSAKALYEQASQLFLVLTPHLETAREALLPLTDTTGGVGGSVEAQLLGRRIKALDNAAEAIFTKNFKLTHEFALESEQRVEIQIALDAPIQKDPLKLETWLQGLVRVRKPLADLAIIRDWGEWMGAGNTSLTPVQLPRIIGEPWIGGSWTSEDEMRDRLSIMLIDDEGKASGVKAGIFLDGFSETVPSKVDITGVSFHYDRPNAEAPQVILVAVPPVPEKGWSWDALRSVVFDTFDRARLRAVEPDHLIGSEYFHVLPANLVPFSSGFPLSTLLASNATTLSSVISDKQ